MSAYTHFSRYYDSLTGNVGYKNRSARLDALIQKYNPGARLLLDLACGTGNLSFELASLGYDVTGVDSSVDMLGVAIGKKDEQDILFLNQKMEELDLYGTVDAAVCLLDSVNHLTDPSRLLRTFERLKLFVAPGGVLIFDVNSEYKHRVILGNNSFIYDLPDIFCAWRNNCLDDGTVEISLDFFEPLKKGGYHRSSEHFKERYYPREELLDMLNANSFELLDTLDGDAFSQPKEDSQRLLYVARRTG